MSSISDSSNTVAILICFQYTDDNKLNSIPYDICRMSYLSKKFDMKKCYVLSDFDKSIEPHVANDIHRLSDEKVQPKIQDIVDDVDINILQTSDYVSLVTNIQNIYDSFDVIPEHLFLYYSGHGLPDVLILPDGQHMNPRDLLDLFIGFKEILVVVDCCYASSFSLSFKLNENKLTYIKQSIPCKSNVILITGSSAEKKEKAISARYGSIFTTIFFEQMILDDKVVTRNLSKICQYVIKKIYAERNGFYQSASAYFSRCIPHVLWSWFSVHIPGKKYVEFDLETNCLRVKL